MELFVTHRYSLQAQVPDNIQEDIVHNMRNANSEAKIASKALTLSSQASEILSEIPPAKPIKVDFAFPQQCKIHPTSLFPAKQECIKEQEVVFSILLNFCSQ